MFKKQESVEGLVNRAAESKMCIRDRSGWTGSTERETGSRTECEKDIRCFSVGDVYKRQAWS